MSRVPWSPTIHDAVERFCGEVRRRFQQRVREIVLFGSQARGDADEESDVDLLVVIDELTEAERKLVFNLAYDAGAAAEEFVALSPLPYSTAQTAGLRARERRLMLDISRDGVAL
ncbi:MAG TPA: nucleotidyltransferase domain-containing protein [Polyangiaceae bacterium]|nr:nucleotidyltransferase domain-containing protein [Polyangiaceae bacterium]